MLTVLVTGATGKIGSALVRTLQAHQHVHVVALARNVEELHEQNVTWVSADVRSETFRDVVAKFQPDTVVHAAWDYSSDTNLAQCATAFSSILSCTTVKRVIYLSSVAVYGARKAEMTCDESDSLETGYLDEYAEQKRQAEFTLQEISASVDRAVEVIVLRPCRVCKQLPRIMKVNQWIRFPSPHAISRQFVHIQDAVSVITYLSLYSFGSERSYLVYNLASSPIRVKTFWFPVAAVRHSFAILWYISGWKRVAPRKWLSYLYTPQVDGKKACVLCLDTYRRVE